MRLKRSIKSISSLIAVIILIAITVVGGLLVFAVMNQTMTGSNKKSLVNFESLSLYQSVGEPPVVFSATLKNAGNKPVKQLIIQLHHELAYTVPSVTVSTPLEPSKTVGVTLTSPTIHAEWYVVGNAYPTTIRAETVDGGSFSHTASVVCLGQKAKGSVVVFVVSGVSTYGPLLTVNEVTYSFEDFSNSSLAVSGLVGSQLTYGWSIYVADQPGETSKRYRWDNCEGLSTAQSNTITIPSAGGRIQGNYVTQYKANVTCSGLDSSALGTVVTVDGSAKTLSDLPFTNWYDYGTAINYSYLSFVASSTANKRFGWLNTTGPASPITVSAPLIVTGNYLVQWQITFTHSGLDSSATGIVVTADTVDVLYGSLPYSKWVSEGATVTYSYKSPVSSSTDGKRFDLTSVSGPTSPFTVTASTTLTGNYVVYTWTDYLGNKFVYLSTGAAGIISTNQKISNRFTSQQTKNCSKVAVALNAIGSSSLVLRIGIQTDVGGNPSGTWLGATNHAYVDFASAVPGPTWAWYTLMEAASLVKETVYYIVIERVSGTVTNVNQMLPNLNTIIPYDQVVDANMNALFFDGSSWSLKNRTPAYIIQFSDDTLQGQPFTEQYSANCRDPWWQSEYFKIKDTDKLVSTISVYASKVGNPGDLRFELKDVTDNVLVESGVIPAAEVVSGWNTYNLSVARNLQKGKVYSVKITTTGSSSNYYSIPICYHRGGISGLTETTYDGADSYLVSAWDGTRTDMDLPIYFGIFH